MAKGNKTGPAFKRRRTLLKQWLKLKTDLLPVRANSRDRGIVLDVIIPVIERDMEILPYVVEGARQNIQHKIGRIFVVAPDSARLKVMCAQIGCQYCLEDGLMPIAKDDIHYTVDGVDRAGWIYQQLLKLNADQISDEDYCLVLDADTVMLRPQVFLHNGIPLFNISDEYHHPYFDTYQRLFDPAQRFPRSFVAHYMLLEKAKLCQLKTELENRHHQLWYRAIITALDPGEASSFSEFETYAHYVRAKGYPAYLEYWCNLSLSRTQLRETMDKKGALKRRFKSVSFHYYNG